MYVIEQYYVLMCFEKQNTNPRPVHTSMVTLSQDPGHDALKISILVPWMKSVYLNN